MCTPPIRAGCFFMKECAMGVEIRTDRRDDAFAVRRRVFMEEQGYTDEFDAIDYDARCIHVTLYVDGELVGCSRIFPEPLERTLAPSSPQSPASPFDEGVAHDVVYLLGRVAVLPAFRRRGLAGFIVQAGERAAQESGAQLIKLHAQEYVQSLYTKQGYEQIALVDYEDEGQPHVWMAKKL